MTKQASVDYTPTVGGVYDSIKAKYGETVLASQSFYISPRINIGWDLPDKFIIDESAAVSLTPILLGAQSVNVTDGKIIDQTGATVHDNITSITSGEKISFNYTASEGMESAEFTLKFTIANVEWSEKSGSIPCEKRNDKYTLSAENLTHNKTSKVTLTAENTDIPTGSDISFESDYGLKAIGKLEDV